MDEINLIPSVTSKKSSAVVIKIIAGVVVLGVIGTGICLGTRVWDPLWNPFRPSPEKVIEEMLANMKEVKILHSKVRIAIEAKDEEGIEMAISLLMNNDSDATDPKNLKVSTDFDATITALGLKEKFFLAGESRGIGEASYLKMAKIDIPSDFQPLLMILGINLDEIIGQWIKIDKEALENLTGQTYVPQEISEDEQEAMIKKLQELFEERKVYYVKEEMPDEEINGKKAYHYLLALDKEEIKKVIPEMFKIIIESSGQSLGVDEFTTAFIVEGLAESINKSLEKVGDITAEMWIGKKDKLFYKIEGEKEIDLDKFDKQAKGIIDVKIGFEFSNFNQPVEIKVPETFKSLEEIFTIPQIPTTIY